MHKNHKAQDTHSLFIIDKADPIHSDTCAITDIYSTVDVQYIVPPRDTSTTYV